jgi:hypothetical protein
MAGEGTRQGCDFSLILGGALELNCTTKVALQRQGGGATATVQSAATGHSRAFLDEVAPI